MSTSNSQFPKRKPRASEKVLQYLEAEFDRPDLEDGTRLPPMRELASRLGVSVFTVQTVFQRLAREGRIRTKVGSGSYLVSDAAPPRHGIISIGIDIRIPQAGALSDWGSRIIHGILAAAGNADQSVTIHPMSTAADESPAPADQIDRDVGNVAEAFLQPATPFRDLMRASEPYDNHTGPIT